MKISRKVLIIIIIIILVVVFVYWMAEIGRFNRLRRAECDDIVMAQVSSVLKPKISKHRVVISLTTTPKRIWKMKPAILSFIDQSVHVDEIAVNISKVSSKGEKYVIPNWLQKLVDSPYHSFTSNYGRVCVYYAEKDMGPATKLLPTLIRESPTTRIVVVDDDIIYHSHTVKNLVKRFEELNQGNVCCAVSNFGVCIGKDGKVPLSNWGRVTSFVKSERSVDLLQGFSGYVVSGDLFPKEVFDIEEGPEEAFFVDDVWFSGWLGHKGIEIRQIRTMWQLPLPNYGEMYALPSLSNTSPAAYEYDHATINWFIKNTNFRPKSYYW